MSPRSFALPIALVADERFPADEIDLDLQPEFEIVTVGLGRRGEAARDDPL
jgi:hypothetical protein